MRLLTLRAMLLNLQILAEVELAQSYLNDLFLGMKNHSISAKDKQIICYDHDQKCQSIISEAAHATPLTSQGC